MSDTKSNEDKSKGEGQDADGSSQTDAPKPSGTRENPAPTAVIWITRAVTAALLLAIIGYLLHMIAREPVPVKFDIDADFEAIRQTNNGCALPVDLTNVSTHAVGSITLTAANEPDSDVPEVLTTTFSLMGQGESVRSELVFGQCPDPSTLDLRVTSYQSP